MCGRSVQAAKKWQIFKWQAALLIGSLKITFQLFYPILSFSYLGNKVKCNKNKISPEKFHSMACELDSKQDLSHRGFLCQKTVSTIDFLKKRAGYFYDKIPQHLHKKLQDIEKHHKFQVGIQTWRGLLNLSQQFGKINHKSRYASA